MAELAALAPDVILAHGSGAVGAVLQATRSVPIVFPIAGIKSARAWSTAWRDRAATQRVSWNFEYSVGGKWLDAISIIVDQGEGASREDEHSHFNRFRKIQDEWQSTGLKDFDPAFPAATSPALRKPVGNDVHRVWITNPQAAGILDVANASYGLMLSCLDEAYSPLSDTSRRQFIGAALRLMKAVMSMSEQLARLPAGPEHPGVCAGMSFMTPRNLGPRDPRFAAALLRERALILKKHADSCAMDVEGFFARVVVQTLSERV